MTSLAVHGSRHLGDTAACRDRRQCMDRQLTQRYVVDKDHGKQTAQRIFRCHGSRRELEGLKNQGNGWGGDHQDLVQEIDFPLSKPLAPARSHSRMSCPTRLVLRRSQLLYANVSGQLFFQRWPPSLLHGILGFIILHRIDPFIVAQPQAQNTQTFCDYP